MPATCADQRGRGRPTVGLPVVRSSSSSPCRSSCSSGCALSSSTQPGTGPTTCGSSEPPTRPPSPASCGCPATCHDRRSGRPRGGDEERLHERHRRLHRDAAPGPGQPAADDGQHPRPVRTYFANLFGLATFNASRDSKAEYVLPVPMGSPQNYYGVGFYEQRVAYGHGQPGLDGLPGAVERGGRRVERRVESADEQREQRLRDGDHERVVADMAQLRTARRRQRPA